MRKVNRRAYRRRTENKQRSSGKKMDRQPPIDRLTADAIAAGLTIQNRQHTRSPSFKILMPGRPVRYENLQPEKP